MTDTEMIVQRYLAVWNEPQAELRADLIARLWTDDGTYTDPLAQVQGHQAIAGLVAQARQMFPGHTFRARPGSEGHHDLVRFGWELVPADGGEPPVLGFDVAMVAPDGRLSAVHGFLDRVRGS